MPARSCRGVFEGNSTTLKSSEADVERGRARAANLIGNAPGSAEHRAVANLPDLACLAASDRGSPQTGSYDW